MTTCERQREQIGAFLDGELGAGEGAAFEAHLSTCAGCRQALEDQRQLAQAFAELAPVAAPPDFEARFWARIAREHEAPAGFGARLRGFFSPVRALALAGATAAALLLFVKLACADLPGRGRTVVEPADGATPSDGRRRSRPRQLECSMIVDAPYRDASPATGEPAETRDEGARASEACAPEV